MDATKLSDAETRFLDGPEDAGLGVEGGRGAGCGATTGREAD
jgi:hypothetical protein